jgi:CRP-like cAMP-binding protein
MLIANNWISELPAAVREAMQARMTHAGFAAGTTIKRAGDTSTAMYQVESGYVRLLTLHPDGREVLLLLYGPGNCWGESPMVARRGYNHTTIALTDVRVRVLAEREFWALYDEFREIPDALCRKFANNTSRQFIVREIRATRRLKQLIGMTFEILADDAGVVASDGSTAIDLPLTQADFADHLEVTRQAVQREIGAMKHARILDQGRGGWVIRDRERLKNWTRSPA